MNKKVAAGIGLIAGALGLYLWTKKKAVAKPTECAEGATKCDAGNLYTCVNGKWELQELNSPQCPQGCTEGTTKCIGTDLYTCTANSWQLTEANSPSCKVEGVFYSPYGCIRIGDTPYWLDRASLIESMTKASWNLYRNPTDMPIDARDCVRINSIEGPDWSGIYYLACPYCNTSSSSTNPNAIVDKVLNHIEQGHPDLPLNKPPCWVGAYTMGGFYRTFQVVLDGSVQHTTTPGSHHVVIKGKPFPHWVFITLIDTTVNIPNWGDRVTINIDTGEVTTQTWESLTGERVPA